MGRLAVHGPPPSGTNVPCAHSIRLLGRYLYRVRHLRLRQWTAANGHLRRGAALGEREWTRVHDDVVDLLLLLKLAFVMYLESTTVTAVIKDRESGRHDRMRAVLGLLVVEFWRDEFMRESGASF